MRIAIDFDDTIVNTSKTVKDFLVKYDFEIKSSDDKIKFYKKHVDDITKCLGFIDEAKETIKLLNHKHEIYLITARNDYDYSNNLLKLTDEFIAKNNLNFTKVIYDCFGVNKAKECKNNNIDLFIDNDVRNCLEVSKLGINTILFGDLVDEKKYKEEIKNLNNVKTWKEILNYLNN